MRMLASACKWVLYGHMRNFLISFVAVLALSLPVFAGNNPNGTDFSVGPMSLVAADEIWIEVGLKNNSVSESADIWLKVFECPRCEEKDDVEPLEITDIEGDFSLDDFEEVEDGVFAIEGLKLQGSGKIKFKVFFELPEGSKGEYRVEMHKEIETVHTATSMEVASSQDPWSMVGGEARNCYPV
jgi:hypothetical protein